MGTYYIVSAIGRDRPGFVHGIASATAQAGGNIAQQRSTRMAGEYALLMLVSIPGDPPAQASWQRGLESLRGDDMWIQVRHALADAASRPQGARPATLVVSGADNPGIIDAVTLVLYERDINLEAMEFDTEPAPMTGDDLFRMTANLAIPGSVDANELDDQFRDLEADLNINIDLSRY